MIAIQLCCARHCELPLSKMGSKRLFPGVAVPLAFFCTLFFRHRQKSVSAPWDGKSQFAPESARHSPPGDLLTAKLLPNAASRRAFRSPPCTLFGSPPKAIERPIGLQALLPRRSRRANPHPGQGVCACGRTKGLSARPLETFGSPLEAIERPIGLQALLLAPESARQTPPRGIAYDKVAF